MGSLYIWKQEQESRNLKGDTLAEKVGERYTERTLLLVKIVFPYLSSGGLGTYLVHFGPGGSHDGVWLQLAVLCVVITFATSLRQTAQCL